MNVQATPPGVCAAACSLSGKCPLCGEANHCRLESGEGYKGPCWCERPTVSPAALRRLLAEVIEPRCVCVVCLERIAADPEISAEALLAREVRPSPPKPAAPLTPIEGDFYWEGPAMVFTEQYHLRRGACCGSGCRHCPFRRRS